MKLKGAEIVVQCLLEQEVEYIFGFPGGAVLNIYDAIYKYRDQIIHVMPCHEQAAAHAADGYARASGKVGVCLATSGPGATNLVTGIATAFMDSVPMVAITGNVPLPLLGKDAFQEVDIHGITMPITKHNYIVKDVRELADTIRKAFEIAQEGRPGPVLIDVPKDITAQETDYEFKPKQPSCKQVPSVLEADLELAVQMINQAQKPLIFSGGGIIKSKSNKELLRFVEKLQAPITVSTMGLGGFPGTHPLHTGMVGMHGTKASNCAVKHCDLLVALGARFSDRMISDVKTFAPNAKILHIDIDPAEINKNVITTHHLIGDLKTILNQLYDRVNSREYDDWNRQVDEWKTKYPLSYPQDDVLRGQYIIEKLYEVTEGDAIISTEVGQHQIWTAQFYKFDEPNRFISSGGLGTMGYGLGAAMGAKLARPDKKVINVAGDGSFRMNLTEIATAVENKIPIIILIINNRALGMVRQWQDMFYDGRFSSVDLNTATDFVKVAEAFGAKGYRVTEKSQLEAVLRSALQEEGPVVIDCMVPSEDKVFPIVPPGAPIHELILELKK